MKILSNIKLYFIIKIKSIYTYQLKKIEFINV